MAQKTYGPWMGPVMKVLILTVLLGLLWASSAFGADFEITHYDIHMAGAPDNSYRITETLDVQFYRDQHGIFRDIPTVTYKGYNAFVEDIRVEGIPFETTREGKNLRIRIGDPNAYAPQTQRYVISYRYVIGDDRLKDMDELYFNLIGTGWQTAIRGVSFTIVMPKAFDAERLNFTYGPPGSTENTAVSYGVDGNSIQGVLQRELGPGEALTVALPLQEGYFSEARLQETPFERVLNFRWLLMSLPLLFGTGVWLALGKNRRIFPTVEFYPPPELNPAETGYVFDGQVNPYDISSLIIYWADKGYLRIIEKEEEQGRIFKKMKTVLYLERLTWPSEGPDHELTMFTTLFQMYSRDNVVCVDELAESFYTTANDVERRLKKELQGGAKGPIFERKGWAVVLMVRLMALICAAFTVIQVIAVFNPYFTPLHLVFGLLGGVVASIPVWGFTRVLHQWGKMLPDRRLKALVGASIGMAVLLGAAGYGALSLNLIPEVALGLALTVALNFMAEDGVRRSPRGDAYKARIMGFRDFLLHAEKDRIELLVEENPAYFYNVLPYAMVLGVTDKWARKFEGIALSPPDWYRQEGRYGSGFSPVDFSHQLNLSMLSMAGAMSSSPSSSGSGDSSGGGSSGGGSGGGGGGSW